MTSSTDPEAAEAKSDGPFGTSWRAQREALQQGLMPSGQVVVSSPAPFGAGGLGRHLKEIADAIDRGGQPAICMCGEARGHMSGSCSSLHHELRVSGLATSLGRLTRFSPAWNSLRRSIAFDGYAAQRLPAAEHLIAFNGQALKQIDVARQAGYSSVALLGQLAPAASCAPTRQVPSPISAGGLVGDTPSTAQPQGVRTGRSDLRRVQVYVGVVCRAGL